MNIARRTRDDISCAVLRTSVIGYVEQVLGREAKADIPPIVEQTGVDAGVSGELKGVVVVSFPFADIDDAERRTQPGCQEI